MAVSAQNAVFHACGAVCPFVSKTGSRLCSTRLANGQQACLRAKSCTTEVQRSKRVVRATKEDQEEDELPPWARREELQKLQAADGQELPFGVYLIGSALVSIAAVGSIFEWINKNPIFGVLPPSSALYTPILGFFAVTGFPTAAFLFIKAINAANKESDRQNKIDGY